MYSSSQEQARPTGGLADSSSEVHSPDSWKPSAARELVDVVYRYRWLIAATFITTVLSTTVWLFIRHDVYETTAKVLVRFARDSFNPRAETSSTVARMLPAPKPDLATETDLIGSYAIISQVVDRLHLDKPGPPKPPPTRFVPRVRYELREAADWLHDLGDEIQYSLAVKERLSPRDKAIVEVSESLAVETAKDSSILAIKLKTKFREGASVILNTLVDIYSEQRMKVESNPRKGDLLEAQASAQRDKLQDQERTLESLKRKAGIYAPLSEQLDLANRRVLDAENQTKATGALIASLEAKASTLATQLDQQKPTRVVNEVDQRNTLLDTLNEKRSGLVLERQKLLGKFSDEHASIKDIDNQIAQADRLIASTKENVRQSQTTSLNQNFTELEKQSLETRQSLRAAQAQLAAQQSTVIALREDRARLMEADPEYRRLTRAITIDEEAYKFQRRNSDEFKTAEAMTAGGITQIAVVDKAVDPIVPKGVRKIYILGGSIAAGLLVAFGLAFVCNGLDGSVTSASVLAEEIKRPPLAVIPWSKAIRRELPPEPEFGREAAAIASEIDELHRRSGLTAVSLAAPHKGAGVSTVATSVSDALAKTLEKSVLLLRLSADPRDKELSQINVPSPVRNGSPERIDAALAASLTGPQIAEKLHALLRRAGYDLTIIDVDATLPQHQQAGAAAGSQATLLVAEAGKTQKTQLRTWRSKLEGAGARIAGAILTKQRRGWGQQA